MYKLWMFGIPIYGPEDLFYDNHSMMNNVTLAQ